MIRLPKKKYYVSAITGEVAYKKRKIVVGCNTKAQVKHLQKIFKQKGYRYIAVASKKQSYDPLLYEVEYYDVEQYLGRGGPYEREVSPKKWNTIHDLVAYRLSRRKARGLMLVGKKTRENLWKGKLQNGWRYVLFKVPKGYFVSFEFQPNVEDREA
jgi:hypothetical protein